MKIEPHHLEIVAAIVEHGGLTEGAAALGKSQPSVSRSLAALEKRLGLRLFEPNRKPLQPTAFCLELAREGQKVRRAGDTAKAMVERLGGDGAPNLRVAAPPLMVDMVLRPLIQRLRPSHPELIVDLRPARSAEVRAQLRDGAIDLGFVPMRPSDDPEGLAFAPQVSARSVIAAPAGHALTQTHALWHADILPYPWILASEQCPCFADLRELLKRLNAPKFEISFMVGSMNNLIHDLTRAQALTVLPAAVAFLQPEPMAIIPLPLTLGDPELTLARLWNPNAPPKGPAAAFAGLSAAELRSVSDEVDRKHAALLDLSAAG